MKITNEIAQDFIALHNKDIRENWEHTKIDLVLISLESYPLEENGIGGYNYEIPSNESRTGRPIIFEFPLSITD